MKFINRHLATRLFLAFLLVTFVGMFIMAATAQVALPRSFNRHMMGELPEQTPSGRGPMMGERAANEALFERFSESFREVFLWSVLAAAGVALIVSLWLSRRIVAPIESMMRASQRIAQGNFGERVAEVGEDELGRLGHSFNDMAEQLEQVETRRRQLIGDVSHELRTPLTTIKGSMEGLMDGVLPANAETFEQIHREADRLARLVDDLQELSRVEAKSYSLDVRPMALSALGQILAKRLARQFEQKSIALSLDLPESLPLVLADEDRLVQILTNLLGNALQYTPAPGTVTVTAALAAGEMQITVADTGVGIPPEHLPHIFDRFYRVDKSRSRTSGGGSGIGLTVARHLVESHGGRIWAESAGAGQGSRFVFTLPVA
jgi:signal transduction histidine kinase